MENLPFRRHHGTVYSTVPFYLPHVQLCASALEIIKMTFKYNLQRHQQQAIKYLIYDLIFFFQL